jgi:serine/threonine protein kinase
MAQDTGIGSTIAGYRVERLLGRGGMSVVHLAEDTRLGRKVALKILAPELAEDERFRDRFVRESRLAASLEHPNIVPIHEAGEADGRLFIAMRYVEGTDLKALLADGPLEIDRTVAIIDQVARALDAAHAKGLVHRDVKPGNVLIASAAGADREHAYLSDFGLTKRSTSDSGMTGTGQFLGTVDYAAPEQFEGKQLDARTDVYSLGCILYECLVGEPPFVRDREVAVMYAHMNERPPRPSMKRAGIPDAVDGVVSKAMTKSPQNRFASAGEVAASARDALRREAPQAPSAPPPRTRLLALAASIVVVIAVVAAVLLTRGSGTPNPSASGSSTSSAPAVPFSQGVLALDPKTGRIQKMVPGPGVSIHAGANGVIAVGEGAIWSPQGPAVIRINPRTGARRSIPVNYVVADIAVGQGAVWVLGGLDSSGFGNLDRIDPATNEVQKELTGVGGGTDRIVPTLGSVWVGSTEGLLTRVDAGTNHPGKDFQIAGNIQDLTTGQGNLWALDSFDSLVLEIDPRTGKLVRRISVNGSPTALAVGFGSVWVLDQLSGTVAKLDPKTGHQDDLLRVGNGATDIATGFGAVWVTNQADDTISRIQSVSDDVQTIDVGGQVSAVVPDPDSGYLWVVVSPFPRE